MRLRRAESARRYSVTDADLLAGLRAGDRTAYRTLVRLHHANLVRLAALFARGNRATAEEVVQETWIVAFTDIGRFQGASSLRAWLGGIVVHKAKSRARRDGRMVAFSELAVAEATADEPAVDPDRFLPDGHWAGAPTPWEQITPEREAAGREEAGVLAAALDTLPEAQRGVVLLADVHGMDAPAVCAALGITEANRRVLLHRARARLRTALEARNVAPPARDRESP